VSRTFIWLGVLLGSSLGGYLPTLFGAGLFSGWSVLGSVAGGIGGVFAGNRLGRVFGL
jgi:hypothetical protein